MKRNSAAEYQFLGSSPRNQLYPQHSTVNTDITKKKRQGRPWGERSDGTSRYHLNLNCKPFHCSRSGAISYPLWPSSHSWAFPSFGRKVKPRGKVLPWGVMVGDLLNCASGKEAGVVRRGPGVQAARLGPGPSVSKNNFQVLSEGALRVSEALAGRPDLKHSAPHACSASPREVDGGQCSAGHNVPSLWGGVKETCPAGSWGHSRLVIDGPARGQGPPPPAPYTLSSHLRHPSVAREHSISHFQKLWENSPVGHMAFEAKLSSLTSTLYLTPQDPPSPEQ